MHPFTCPACGFRMFDEPPGSYAICHICGWEDDHVQLRYPLLQGGANKESLREIQIHILKEIPPEVKEHQGYKRDPEWRPLNEKDILSERDLPKTGLEYFNEASRDNDLYYWKIDP